MTHLARLFTGFVALTIGYGLSLFAAWFLPIVAANFDLPRVFAIVVVSALAYVLGWHVLSAW